MNSLDKELIDAVAALWISKGGDSIGFQYTWDSVLEAIRELEQGVSK